MLRIINNLKPFFEDNYERINVREYARITGMSPPTASKLLKEYKRLELLKEEPFKNYNFYFANKDSKDFIDFQRMYYHKKLKKVISHIEKELISPTIILFGSLSKAEAKADSDIDLAIFTPSKKELNLKNYEKNLNRKIQLFLFKDKEGAPKELLNNILNGYKLQGEF